MARTYFRRSTTGRSPVGGVIEDVQKALNAAGVPPITVDGDFGGQTAGALKQFQTLRQMPVTGEVDDGTWPALMNSPAPPIFERCLQLAAAFEGTGFKKVCGNFDGAGITWGIIGFTLVNGELANLLAKIKAADPTLIAQAFGANEPTLLSMCGAGSTHAEKIAWANSISTGANRIHVVEPWNSAFETLGAFPQVQALQVARARDKYWIIAQNDAAALGMSDELDCALMYDIAVQNGGVPSRADVLAAFAAENPGTPFAKRMIVSRLVAEASAPQWQHDVRLRKEGISTGRATVHGTSYTLADWGLMA